MWGGFALRGGASPAPRRGGDPLELPLFFGSKNGPSGGCPASGGAGAGPCARSAWFTTLSGLMLALFATVAMAAEPSKKPPVPPGVDPGGVLIALIGDGVDYTRPEIAARLARDGEGELIGWDFVDGDRRPFGSSTFETALTAAASSVLREPGVPRIAVFRLQGAPEQNLPQLARSVSNASDAKARVIVLNARGPSLANFLKAVSGRFPDLIMIVPRDEKTELQLNNTVVVGNSNQGCNWVPNIHSQPADADIATNGACYHPANTSMETWTVPLDGTAAARIAALAARIVATEPALTGAELKQRIVALAKPFPEGMYKIAIHGWIEDPSRHYPVK